MNETYQFYEGIRNILISMEQHYGQLKRFSSRVMTQTLHSITDEIIIIIIDILRNRYGMYNIKIFNEDNGERRHIVSIFARCYNYFLLSTNFSSQYLLRKDIRFGHIVGHWPTLSPYLFIQIIWNSKCEDFLIESLVHIPLDLCVEILETIIKHIDELDIPRARRFIFFLIYKIYCKCLWLHFSTLSQKNVLTHIYQLVTYFGRLLNLIVSRKFISYNLIKDKCLQHGILVKDILSCVKMCMRSKIQSYSENHNLAELFRLTYGNYNEYMNYHYMLPAEVKSIVTKLDQQLTTLLLNQIKHVDDFEFMVWRNINDNENITISLQCAIIVDCQYLMKFIRQNEFLITNKHLFHCLEQLIDLRKSEESILTVQKLCHDITQGNSIGMRELIKRYKEWDLSILDFISKKIKLLSLNDFYILLKYLHYTFACPHTEAEKYQVYVLVLKILLHLNVQSMHFIILKYVNVHFDDKGLDYLYNEKSFDEFIRRNSFDGEFCDILTNTNAQEQRAFLIFILLSPKKVLTKIIMYELSTELSTSILFRRSTFALALRCFYNLKMNQRNVLMYILKTVVLQQRIKLYQRFKNFVTNVLNYQMMNADDIMNLLYIPYLMSGYIENVSIHIILSLIYMTLQSNRCTYRTDFLLLIAALIKTSSLLRRCNATFSKFALCRRMIIIDDIMQCLHNSNILPKHEDNLHLLSSYVEPLEIKILSRNKFNTLEIILEYEKRCFVVHRRLRTDPRCHPKLRNYVQSFNLNREAFIRHIMLHCTKLEYTIFAYDLTFVFWYYFGWANEMIAYENVMRITADVSQVALMYINIFPKDTFIMLLLAIIHFCHVVAKNFKHDKHKHKVIYRVLMSTLFSMNHMASKTYYGDTYKMLLKRIENLNPYLSIDKYFFKMYKMTNRHFAQCESIMIPVINKDCICHKGSHCKYHILLNEEKITEMYDTYLFIRECIKFSTTTTHYCFSKRLMHNLYLAE
ncbi:uncharacterized protein LOC105834345 [Monomorium pharaonis]|uniref:uncharacterized protein LOC105834345 n=1 Tax=Monomorium pharaonis TaxID=307658 RepID=UPI00063FCD87|nr:uncharacterized protein LOC105834345 [Monomorium pharaonis]